jgi:glyoxylate reductase
MPTVLVTRRLPPPGISPLVEAGLEVDHHDDDEAMPRAELLARVAGCDGLLAVLTDRVDTELLDAAPRLRVVANLAVGFDNVDVAAAARRGVVVTNTPGVLTEATADLTWALLLAAARRVGEGERLVRSGGWRGWRPTELLGLPVWGRTIGIVGMGAIGTAVARRARGFGMRIVSTSRRPTAGEREVDAERLRLPELLAEAHVVSLHVPLTPDTHHLIDAAALARMRPDAVLVNTARGPVVDEEALVDALARGRPAAAGLDVYEREPEVTAALLDSDRVVLSPHLGSATTETRGAMVELAVTNLVAVLGGRPAVTPVVPPPPSTGVEGTT